MSGPVGPLRWAVKESFIDYIRRLDDGTIDVFDGCSLDDGVFLFPGESERDGSMLFRGGVRFTGFAGMLDVRIVDPLVETAGAEGAFSALVGPPSIAARVTLAMLEGAPSRRSHQRWTASPRLTFEGARIFGDVYPVGTELAPLIVDSETS